jgi:heme exporter protein A
MGRAGGPPLWRRSYSDPPVDAIKPKAVDKGVTELPIAGASSLVLKVENLAASRGLRLLFAKLSFTVSGGEVMELRGANGSGKSTLLRILAGLTRQHFGTVAYSTAKADPEEEAGIHYLGHLDAVKPTETAGQQALFWARFFGRKDDEAWKALERVGLTSRIDVPGRGLSAGQKRRLALARLLIEPRPVWLLDEPTAALDMQGRSEMDLIVAEHVAAGGLVVAAMHGQGFPNARTLDVSQAAAGVAA